jgi:hypothetical protein
MLSREVGFNKDNGKAHEYSAITALPSYHGHFAQGPMTEPFNHFDYDDC